MSKPNWANQTMWTGDNLPIMRGINSESVDLIYLNPPFNSNADYAAPIGSEAAGAEFKDTWTLRDVDVAWLDLIQLKHPKLNRVIDTAMTDSDKSYLIYMAARLLEMHRVLKSIRSIYLHCDFKLSHYLKLLMDSIWGEIFNVGYDDNYADRVNYKRRRKYFVRDEIYGRNMPSHGKRFAVYRERFVNDYAHDPKPEMLFFGLEEGDWGRCNMYRWWTRNLRKALIYPTQKPLVLLRRIIETSTNRMI